jgi:hypothetical protein
MLYHQSFDGYRQLCQHSRQKDISMSSASMGHEFIGLYFYKREIRDKCFMENTGQLER